MNDYIVTFDLWNTIFKNKSYKKKRVQIITTYLQHSKRRIEEVEVSAAYSQLAFLLKEYKTSKNHQYVPCLKRLDYIVNSKLNANVNSLVLERLLFEFQQVVFEDPPELAEYAKEILNKVSRKAHLAVVSDTGFSTADTMRKLLRYYNLLDYFEYLIFSEETGFNKPNPKMFSEIINNTYQIGNANIVHIGDLYDTDIMLARVVDVHSIEVNANKINTCYKDQDRWRYCVNNLYDAEIAVKNMMDW